MIAVDGRYRAIVIDLAADAIDELWLAAIFGRPARDALRDRLIQLVALRDEVGRSSALRRDLVVPIGGRS